MIDSKIPSDRQLVSPAELTGEIQAYSGNRDATLQELLGTDYGFAHETGLINFFYYNPETGEDGLMHVLGGEYFIDETGARMPSGFHHEPSAAVSWVYNSSGERVDKPQTYVDRKHLDEKNSDYTREFREYPFEPYRAKVVIDGLRKYSIQKRSKKNEDRGLVETNNGMFPKEYDALSVMQAIRQAYDNRDTSLDRSSDSNVGNVLVANGEATMLDGNNRMKIRLLLDEKTHKILSAFPIVKIKSGGQLGLDKQKTNKHLGLV